MEANTSTLTGIELDYEVAKGEGLDPVITTFDGRDVILSRERQEYVGIGWAFIGPIIAKMDIWTREEFTVDAKPPYSVKEFHPAECYFEPYIDSDGCREWEHYAEGADVLEAIKKCLVKRARSLEK